MWFASLAKFIAGFYRRYPGTELRGLLHYLLSRLASSDSMDLLILRELLSKMGGCETLVEVSHQQLDGMAGGRVLRAEVMASTLGESVIKRAATRLRDELVASKTGIPLLVLIAQLRQQLVHRSSSSGELKLISHLYDTAADILIQFGDFLVGADTSMQTSAAMMPSLRTLLVELSLPLPVAFTLVRPLLRAALGFGVCPADAPAHLQRWHPLNEELVRLVEDRLPCAVLECMSPQMYLLFWSLSVYDLAAPAARYELEKKRLAVKIKQVECKPTAGPGALTPKARKQELARLQSVIQEMTDECEVQKKHVEIVLKVLVALKDSFFSRCTADRVGLLADALVQQLVAPRMSLSPTDAVFCSQFFLLLHRLDAGRRFSFPLFLERVMLCIPSLLFCSSEAEAGFLGYGFSHLLGALNKWMNSKAIYDMEAATKPSMLLEPGNDACSVKLDYEGFRRKFRAWHRRLEEVSGACLNSREYIYIRSSLIFLTKLSNSLHYPTIARDGIELLARVQRLESQEKRVDLQVMSRSLAAVLKKQSRDWVDDKGVKSAIAVKPPGTLPPAKTTEAATEKHSRLSEPRATEKEEKPIKAAPKANPARDARGREKGDTGKERADKASKAFKSERSEKEKDKEKERDKDKERQKEKEKGKEKSETIVEQHSDVGGKRKLEGKSEDPVDTLQAPDKLKRSKGGVLDPPPSAPSASSRPSLPRDNRGEKGVKRAREGAAEDPPTSGRGIPTRYLFAILKYDSHLKEFIFALHL